MIPTSEYIIQELQLSSLSPDEQQEILTMIRSHMEDLILETTLANLTDDQLKTMSAEISKDNFDEEKIMRLAAGVPHLQEKLETALGQEWEIIKSNYQKIS